MVFFFLCLLCVSCSGYCAEAKVKKDMGQNLHGRFIDFIESFITTLRKEETAQRRVAAASELDSNLKSEYLDIHIDEAVPGSRERISNLYQIKRMFILRYQEATFEELEKSLLIFKQTNINELIEDLG